MNLVGPTNISFSEVSMVNAAVQLHFTTCGSTQRQHETTKPAERHRQRWTDSFSAPLSAWVKFWSSPDFVCTEKKIRSRKKIWRRETGNQPELLHTEAMFVSLGARHLLLMDKRHKPLQWSITPFKFYNFNLWWKSAEALHNATKTTHTSGN